MAHSLRVQSITAGKGQPWDCRTAGYLVPIGETEIEEAWSSAAFSTGAGPPTVRAGPPHFQNCPETCLLCGSRFGQVDTAITLYHNSPGEGLGSGGHVEL